MLAQLRTSRQPLLGPIPRSKELYRGESGMEKVIMKDPLMGSTNTFLNALKFYEIIVFQ